MTREEYLEWIQTITGQMAQAYSDDPHLQLAYKLGLTQRALADLCYIDSHNTSRVNSMYKRNSGAVRSQAFKPKNPKT